MSKNTINEIADLDKPLEHLAQMTEKICRECSVTTDNAKKLIASKFGIPTWYQFERQLNATIRQREGGRELFNLLKKIDECISLSKFDRNTLSNCSKQLLALSLQDCIDLPTHFQDHLISLNYSEWHDYADDTDVDIHLAINNWAEYSNFRFRDTLSEQLNEFVRFKINTRSVFSKGDLLDKHSGMHTYVRCHPDGSSLTLSEFWCQKSPHITLSDHENFVKQSFRVIEDIVQKLPVDLGLMDVRLEFKSADGERFYQDVFLKSRISRLFHKKRLISSGAHDGAVEYLEIQIALSSLYEKTLL
ncbi:hypothetical protein [Rheinheimera texasensis]|uniref:hypothetical protein n=1 Tax=Rheinheimera texasensis TaxID=306205 RepID=UPI0004E1C12A|nr:hypothetical protein [Rheinheimera texasensis]